MPEDALRSWHLRQHWVRASTGKPRPPDLYRALRVYADRPLCPAGCGWPLAPDAGTVHPGCEADHD